MSAGNIQTELHTQLAGGFNVSWMGVFCANHHDRKNMHSQSLKEVHSVLILSFHGYA